MSHETQLKFECFTCGRKFKTKQYLKSHLYKHDKGKPFVFGVLIPSDLFLLLVQPFNCPNCTKRFKHKKTLDKHMSKQHRMRKSLGKVSDSLNKNNMLADAESEDEDMESTDDSTSENGANKSNSENGSQVTNTGDYHLDYRDGKMCSRGLDKYT